MPRRNPRPYLDVPYQRSSPEADPVGNTSAVAARNMVVDIVLAEDTAASLAEDHNTLELVDMERLDS